MDTNIAKLDETSSSGSPQAQNQSWDFDQKHLISNNNDSPRPLQDGPEGTTESVIGSTSKNVSHNTLFPRQTEECASEVASSHQDSEKASYSNIGAGGKDSVDRTIEQAELQSVGKELVELHYNIRFSQLAHQVAEFQSITQQFTRLEEKLDRFAALYVETEQAQVQQAPAERVTAIPELKLLPWSQYLDGVHRGRNIKDDAERLQKEHYAIDVLSGEPIFWWQKEKSKTQAAVSNIGQWRDVSVEPGFVSTVSKSLRVLPDRIRLNSRPLISLMIEYGEVREAEASVEPPWVIRKPYKILLYYESKLKQLRDKLHEKWGLPPDSANHQSSQPQISEACSSLERDTLTGEEKARHHPAKVSTNSSLRDSAEALRDLECLIGFIDEYLNPRVERYQKLNHPKIRFDDLWYLFSPGDLVICGPHPLKAWRVLVTSGGRHNLATTVYLEQDTIAPAKHEANPFTILCCYLDFDGQRFREILQDFKIESFDNEKEVISLKVFPLRYHHDAEKLRMDLIERGRDFLKCIKKPQMRKFSGRTLNSDRKGIPLKDKAGNPILAEDVEAQVIIDMDRALRTNYHWAPKWGEKDTCQRYRPEDRETLQRLNGHCDRDKWCPEDFSMDSWLDIRRLDDILKANDSLAIPESLDLSEDNLLILSGHAFGFILRTRKWACFPLDKLREVKPSKKGFEDLQLRDKEYKRIIKALVRTHLGHKPKRETDSGVDLVAGKGEGLVILLHGSPGVGKTSTAECIADYTGKPLLPITSGDLGVRADTVQDILDENFQLAEAWDCILLLDEADVFLSSRDRTSLERNALVSVFLRRLEYYTGILFLTTNRVGGIDEAVKSRIRVSLHYPALNLEQALSIWDLNLSRILKVRAMTLQADEKQKQHLKNWAIANLQDPKGIIIWNGRQIRDAFSTAAALAEFEAPELVDGGRASLETKFFDVVMITTKDFDQYLLATRQGKSDEDRLAQLQIRSLERDQSLTPFASPAGNIQMTTPIGGSVMQHMHGIPTATYQNPTQSSFVPQTAKSSQYQSEPGQQFLFQNAPHQQTPIQGMMYNSQIAAQHLSPYHHQQGQHESIAYQGFQSPSRPHTLPQPGPDSSQAISQGQAGPGLPVTPNTPSFHSSTSERPQVMQDHRLNSSQPGFSQFNGFTQAHT